VAREDGALILGDGRTLGYAEYGDPAGQPVVFFHPTPGSRLDGAHTQPSPLRVIAIDRPGYGGSDPLPDRTLLRFAGDVSNLADALGIGRFSVAGVSGGGPHALACAAALPDRVHRAAIVCGVGPLHEMRSAGLLEDAAAPPTDAEVAAQAAAVRENAELIAEMGISQSPAVDRRLFTPERVALWIRSVTEGTRIADGMVSDYRAFVHPWGFDLTTIQTPVGLWYGDEDPVVPLAQGRYLLQRLPHATLTVMPGVGHLGAPLAALREVAAFIQGTPPQIAPD
jgi:pimeloyl-ACP methyl ester carboxylesterase